MWSGLSAWRARSAFALSCVCAVLGGCVVDDPRESGVVVMDEQALGGGATLEQYAHARTASALPLLVDADQPLTVRTGAATRTFMVGYGELVRVSGAQLELARYRFERDIYRDRLEIAAQREAADEVAAQTSAQRTELAQGIFELRVANAFVHMAQLDPAGISAVRPVALAQATPVAGSGERSSSRGLRNLDREASSRLANTLQQLDEQLDPVGLYRCNDGALFVDAAGRFHSCTLGSGRYHLQGSLLTLESTNGQVVLQLDHEDGSLTGSADIRCALAATGEAP
jgi:hypothetical protein